MRQAASSVDWWSMRFAYFDRLSRSRQRIYLRSDAIESLGLPPGLEREVEPRELELDADHVRREDAQGLFEELLPRFVPSERHDRFVLHASGH